MMLLRSAERIISGVRAEEKTMLAAEVKVVLMGVLYPVRVRESSGASGNLVINFRGAFGNACRQQVDPAERPEPASREVEVEDVIGPLVGLPNGLAIGLATVDHDERGVPSAEALDDLAVGLTVLEDDPAAVEGRDDDGGARSGEDEASGVEWCDHAGMIP